MSLFENTKEVEARALFVGQRLDLKKFEQTSRLTDMPFVIRAGTNGYAVLFRYGVVVLFGLTGIEETAFLRDIQSYINESFEEPQIEDGHFIEDAKNPESVQPEFIRIKKWSLEYLQLFAEVLSKSAVLSHYEEQVKTAFDQMDRVSNDMKTGGWPKGANARHLLKHIGMTLSIQRNMVGQVEITEKPELLWDQPELTAIYMKVDAEYEITERHLALREKLDLIHKTAETMIGLLQEKRTYLVEWYIVILIVIDILMGLFEKYWVH